MGINKIVFGLVYILDKKSVIRFLSIYFTCNKHTNNAILLQNNNYIGIEFIRDDIIISQFYKSLLNI